MLIGLHDSEYEHMPHKSFPNYALMKLSAWHKQQGDIVEWWNALDNDKYDLIYSSKVFDFTEENPYLPPEKTIKGGTGYGLFSELPEEIDNVFPDYSIYPTCDYAIGFLTRGCPNKCPWCYVPEKEGGIKPYRTWQQLVRPDTKQLVLMDNNILACDYGIKQLSELAKTDYIIDLNQGMDIRLVNDEVCRILKKIHWIKYIRFSCDSVSQLPYFKTATALFDKHRIPKSRVFIYILVRSDLDEADYRVQELNKLCRNYNLYAQAERNGRKGIIPTAAQLEFAQRYVYGKCYKSETWREYCQRHKLYY
ncbi:MAG: radical SAM protein [Oscillospiraceae bacterium]|nr:radical SAM protein [Oscillospiraceae bacterium]